MSEWKVVFRPRFNRELIRLHDLRGRHFDFEGLLLAFEFLGNGQPLPEVFQDHALVDDWQGRREFHLAPDDLIIYLRKERSREIVLLRAGTHRQLFRRRLRRRVH